MWIPAWRNSVLRQHRRMSSVASQPHKYVEIGANLLDGQFRGKYHGKKAHGSDFELLLYRAEKLGMTHLMVTSSNLKDARRSLEMCRNFNAEAAKRPGALMKLYTTVGVHPTRTKEFEAFGPSATTEESDWSEREGEKVEAKHPHFNPRTSNPTSKEEYILGLESCIEQGLKDGTVVAIGECGLDYDRLFFSPKEVQVGAEDTFLRLPFLTMKRHFDFFFHVKIFRFGTLTFTLS
jgi:TatD DNase family protein